jgi:hypothetical protein
MTEATPAASDPRLDDGRQSEAALAIRRGAARCLLAHGFAPFTEFTLRSGRRADLIGLSEAGRIVIVEVKSSLADFRADQKWPEYRDWCDKLYFAVAPEFPRAVLPPDAGLIIADRYGGEIVREAPEHRVAAARRRTLTLNLARVAGMRLHALADPELGLEPPPRG